MYMIQIRNISQCQVKILEPGEGEQSVEETIERLVVITGSTQGIQIAINMLSQVCNEFQNTQ